MSYIYTEASGNADLTITPNPNEDEPNFFVEVAHKFGSYEAVAVRNADAGTIAAEVLKAGGVKRPAWSSNNKHVRWYAIESASTLRSHALHSLELADAIDAYHAKPKVTEAQTESVQDALDVETDGGRLSLATAVAERLAERGWSYTPPSDEEGKR